MRPDGSQLNFSQGGTAQAGDNVIGPFTEVGGGGHATLTYYNSGDYGAVGTYTLVDEDSTVYTWKEGSLVNPLTSIVNASGVGWRLMRSLDGNTVTVHHTSGQTMTLVRSIEGTMNVLTVTDPEGNSYIYKSLPNSAGITFDLIPMDLGTVILPGSNPTTITYKYALIGSAGNAAISEVDYNGVPHDVTTYDSAGRANMGSLADGSDGVSVVYSTNATGFVATVTSALGHVTVYQYNSANQLINITGQAQAAQHCSASFSETAYDANGYLQSAVDNNGNTTGYTYADSGQLQQLVEAAGTPLARTTNYIWDTTPNTNRILSATVVGWKKTSYTYNAQNRLASVSVTNLSGNGTANQVLTTTYQYTLYTNGMVHTLSIIHPSPGNSDTDLYTYDTLGNLSSAANGLGQATTYSGYNGLGEVGHVAGPNGETTDYTYDGRGLLLTRTTHPNGTAATWTYTYDGFGLIHNATAPDGAVTTWTRDPEMRVTQILRNDKDGASTETIGYNAMNNITSDTVARGSDVGISMTASYDGLGRLYQRQGNHGQVQTYTYDDNGNVLSVTNAAGHLTSYQYDALNRVITTTESGGATPVAPSGAPSLTVPATTTTGNYGVSWTAVAGATDYTLQERVGSGSWVTVLASGASSWTVSGKVNGSYSYEVKACNTVGCGSWSAVKSITVAIPQPPATAPALTVPASSTTGTYTVSWTAVGTATSYVLQEQINGGSWATIQNTAATSWNTSSRASGSYSYKTQACNAAGCGPWSTTHAMVVTRPPSTAPSLSVPVTNTNGTYTVSWTTVGGATSYTLQEQVNGGSWATVLASAATNWGASGKASGSYGYRTQACNGGGCGPWSGVGSIAVLLSPSPPTSVTAPSYVHGVSYYVSWPAVATAASYNVRRTNLGTGGSSIVSTTSATSAMMPAPSSSQTLQYAAQACNASGCSAFKDASNATTTDRAGPIN